MLPGGLLEWLFKIRNKGGTETFNPATDSLEAISEAVAGISIPPTPVPIADSTANDYQNEVVGNKADAAQITVGVNRSLMGYIKGILNTVLTLATPTNITAGTITTVTNLTNAPANGDLTATMKSSVNTEVDTGLNTAVDFTPTAKSINDILHKDTSYTYSKATDSLEALRDKVDTLPTTAGDATAAELAKVPKSDSTVSWNATALGDINAQVDTALNTIVPASPTAGSLNDILSKAAGGNTFVKATDSLEMLSDKIGAYVGTAGAGVTESVKAELDLIKAKTDTITASGNSTSATYTASGALAQYDLCGVTSDGKAAKITPDWTPQAVPTTFTTIVTGSATTTQSHACWIATDKFIVIYNNNGTCVVKVATIDAAGALTIGAAETTSFGASNAAYPVRIVKLDTDKAQLFGVQNADGKGYSQVVTVSGTTPTLGGATVFTGTQQPTSIDAIQLGTDKCCASWKITGDAVYNINGCTVSGTTQTWGTKAVTTNTSGAINTAQSSITKVATDLVAWFYEKNTNDVWCANVSFSGANPTRNGTDITVLSAASLADANGELTSCSPMANVAFVATVNSSATFVYTNTVTVSGTAAPVAGVGTNITFEPSSGTNARICSCQVLDATHVAVRAAVGANVSESYVAVFEMTSVNYSRLLFVTCAASAAVGYSPLAFLLIQTNGKSIEIGSDGDTLIRARSYTIYYKGLSTYADTVPTPTYGFLGIATEAINDAASGTIGLKGTFTSSGLNPLKKYVRGTDEYNSVKLVNKDYPYGEVLAYVNSATSIDIMIPPGTSDNTTGYMAFEYQPPISTKGPWLGFTASTVAGAFSAWTSYLTAHGTDMFIDNLSYTIDTPNGTVYFVVQVGYGSTTVNVTPLCSIPMSVLYVSAVGLQNSIIVTLNKLRIPAGQNTYIRICNYASANTGDSYVALTLSQLQ